MIKLLTLLLLISHGLLAQQADQEINEQVWEPFIKAFNENDTERFLAVHSHDLVRSPREDGQVINWTQYFEGTKQSNERAKLSKQKRTISLRFLERLSSANQALETGIYQTSYEQPDGSTKDYYGKFLVVLRKENGVWKILVDTDSSENGTINAESFQSAKPMQ